MHELPRTALPSPQPAPAPTRLRSLGFRSVRLCLTAWLLAGSAWAAEGVTVREVRVTGNDRTATEYILQILRLHPGDRYDGGAAALEQRLLNARVFTGAHVVAVPAGPDAVALEITVQERWTLVPIPIFSSAGGDTAGGLFLMESNLAGWGKQLMLGGLFGNRKQTAFGAYRDPSVAGTRLTAGGVVNWRKDRQEQRDDDDAIVGAYRDERQGFGVDAGVRLGDALTLALGGFGLRVSTRGEAGFAPPPRVSDAWGGTLSAELRREDYHFFYVSGVSARAEYRRALPALLGGRDLEDARLRASWSGGNGLGHAWALTAQGTWLLAGDTVVDAFRLGGRAGSRGLTTDALWAERSATATLEYQVPLWRPRWGTLTALGFVDGGLTRWRGDVTRYVAPGLGARLYFAGIALPAVGLDVAEASTIRKPQVSFNIGFQL